MRQGTVRLPDADFFLDYSMNGSTFTMLLHDFKHFPFQKENNSSPKFLLCTDLIVSFSAIFVPSKSNSILKYCFV